MLVKYTGESAEMPESFYYIGKTEPSSEAGLLYIKKQLARCKSCMDGMEGIPEKRAEFLQNRCAYFGIKKYLESFENGI